MIYFKFLVITKSLNKYKKLKYFYDYYNNHIK